MMVGMFTLVEIKLQLRMQLQFLSHIVCHSFQVCKLHNEVGAKVIFKTWSWHIGQTNNKSSTLKAMWHIFKNLKPIYLPWN
jgi:hypothetical protein